MNRNAAPFLSLVGIGQRSTRLRLWHVPLTSHIAYYMAEGKTCDAVEAVVIAIETDAGLTGWSEVCPIPHYLPAYACGVVPAWQELAPVILGGDPVGAEALMAKADAFLPGHVYAKSALDIALWDIIGQAAGLPVHALMGGASARQATTLPLHNLRRGARNGPHCARCTNTGGWPHRAARWPRPRHYQRPRPPRHT